MALQIALAAYYRDHSDWHRWNTAAYKAVLTRRVGVGPAPRSGGFYIIGHRTGIAKSQWLGSVMVATSLTTSPAGVPLPHAFRYKIIVEP